MSVDLVPFVTQAVREVVKNPALGFRVLEASPTPLPSMVTTTISMSFQFQAEVQVPFRQVVAQEALVNLWRTKKYLDEYITHLEGQTTEEEFEVSTEHLVIQNKNHVPQDLLFHCATYLKAVLPDIQVDDLSMLMNVELVDVMTLAEQEVLQ